MWEAYLKEENFKCFYFNAWETDYSEDPLIPFIGRLSSYIEKINPDPEAKKSLKEVKTIAGKIIRGTLPLVVQIATQGLISSNHAQNFFGRLKDLIGGAQKDIGKAISEAVEA